MTHTQEPGRLLVAEDLYEIPDDGFHHYELVEGVLHVSEPPKSWHGAIQARLISALYAHVQPRGLGTVLGEAGFVLRRGPDTVRGPDMAFVRVGRMTARAQDAFLDGAPDLAVEISSPSNTAPEMAKKVKDYLTTGARLVWVVYPRRNLVIVHTPDAVATPLWEDDTLDGGDVLPGFHLPLAGLFADP